jgi:hypothetical protein
MGSFTAGGSDGRHCRPGGRRAELFQVIRPLILPSLIAILIGVLLIVYANPMAKLMKVVRRKPMMTLIYRLLVVLVTLLVVWSFSARKT